MSLIADLVLYGVVGAIIALFVYSFQTLLRQGRILGHLTALQILLFCILYFLIFDLLASEYYQFDRPPRWWDWLQFTMAHALRAADILDVIEEFHLDIQNVKHASHLVATTVMAMHWMVDVFLLGLLWETGLKRWGDRLSRLVDNNAIIIGGGGLLLVVFFITVAVQASGQDRSPLWIIWNVVFLWPLDNLIRVLDIGDSFQLYHIRLHEADLTLWTASLSVAFRLLLSIPVAQLINRIHLEFFQGAGKTPNELIRELGNRETSESATTGLMRFGVHATPALLHALADPDPEIRACGADILCRMESEVGDALNRMGAGTRPFLPALQDALGDAEWHVQTTAAKALGCMGPEARSAIPELVQTLADHDPDVREAVIDALDRIDAHWPQSAETRLAILSLAQGWLDRAAGHHRRLVEILDMQVQLVLLKLENRLTHLRTFSQPTEIQSVMAALKWAVANRSPESQRAIAQGLAQMHREARSAIPLLVQVLTDMEAKKQEAQRRSEAQEEEINCRIKQRLWEQKKTNGTRREQQRRWSVVVLRAGLVVGITWVGLATCQSRITEIRHEMRAIEAQRRHEAAQGQEAKWQREKERHRATRAQRKERRAAVRTRTERRREAMREWEERRREAAKEREEWRREAARKRREAKQAREARRHVRELEQVLKRYK